MTAEASTDAPGTTASTERLSELLEQIDAHWSDQPADIEAWCAEAVAIAASLGETATRIGLTRRLAELARSDDRIDDAYELLERLLHLDDAPPLELARVHAAIAHIARRIGGIDIGEHLRAAVDLSTSADDISWVVGIRLDLGDHLGATGDNSGALDVFIDARRLARSIGDAILSARADDRIAAAHWELGQGALAEEHLRRALAVARAAGDDDLIAHASYRLGWCLADHSAAADGDEALELVRAATDHARQRGDLRRIAECDAVAARVHRENDRPAESIRLLRSAIAVHESLGATVSAAIAMANLASDLEAVGKRKSALGEYRRALELLPDGSPVAASITTRLARLLCTLDQSADALELLEGVTEWFEHSDDATESPRFHIAAARAHLDSGRVPYGRVHAERALRCLNGALLPALHAEVLELLAECEARDGSQQTSMVLSGQAVALWLNADSVDDARRVARRILPRPPSSDDADEPRPIRAPSIGMYL